MLLSPRGVKSVNDKNLELSVVAQDSLSCFSRFVDFDWLGVRA